MRGARSGGMGPALLSWRSSATRMTHPRKPQLGLRPHHISQTKLDQMPPDGNFSSSSGPISNRRIGVNRSSPRPSPEACLAACLAASRPPWISNIKPGPAPVEMRGKAADLHRPVHPEGVTLSLRGVEWTGLQHRSAAQALPQMISGMRGHLQDHHSRAGIFHAMAIASMMMPQAAEEGIPQAGPCHSNPKVAAHQGVGPLRRTSLEAQAFPMMTISCKMARR